MLRRLEKNTKTALVTGASSGIGLCYAHRLASLGYRVVLVSNEKEKLETVAHDIVYQHDVDALSVCMDLTREDAPHALLDYTREKGIYVDVLVNNAGVFIFNPVVETSEERIENMLALHVRTTTMMCRVFAEDMKKRGCKGFILNMSSLSAWMYVPGITLYSATKAYIRSFSKALHHELKHHGIGVTAVCPGGVTTDLYGLSPRYQKLGRRLGVLMSPQRMVTDALRALFARRECYVPGVLNRLFIPILCITPAALWRGIKNKVSKYEH